MFKRKLKKIKQMLPKNEQKKIAQELGYSYSYVNKVLNGKRRNIKILTRAKQIAESYETELTGRAS